MTDEQHEMLNELLDLERGLTTFELDFICDLDDRREDPDDLNDEIDVFELTPNQADKLQEIYNERIIRRRR